MQVLEMQIIVNYVSQCKNCLKGDLGGLECLNELGWT